MESEHLENEELTKRKGKYRLRSSLKKSAENPLGGLDPSDECQDLTLAPQLRRVSFAASSTVKPFVDDPEKNTIWDNTYEEEINSHTDSNNVASLDSHHGDFEKAKDVLANQSMRNLEVTLCSSSADMELSGCLQGEVLLNIEDKENIQMSNKRTHIDVERAKVMAVKPLTPNVALMKTIVNSSDMELTCQSIAQKITSPDMFEGPSLNTNNYTMYQNVDMSMTCKFSNQIINNENIMFSHKVATGLTKCHQSSTDLEFIGQLPQNLQLQIPAGNPNQSAAEMEFTCQFSQGSTVHQMPIPADQNVAQFGTDMECFGTFPRKVAEHQPISNSQEYKNVTQCTDDMESACRFSEAVGLQKYTALPEPQIISNIELVKAVENINQTAADMEFTCHPLNQTASGKIGQSPNTQTGADMESICHLPTAGVGSKIMTHITKLDSSDQTYRDLNVPPYSRNRMSHIIEANNAEMSRHNNLLELELGKRQDAPRMKVKEFGNIPIALDYSMDQSIEDDNIKNTLERKTVTPEEPYSVANQEAITLENVKDALKCHDHDTLLKEERLTTSERSEIKENFLYNNFGKNETIFDQECDLIDTLTSIPDEDLIESVKNQKVIYSQPLIKGKPSTSILDFSGGFSSLRSSAKKQFCVSSVGSMDGTQQLIEATFSKQFQKPDASRPNADMSGLSLLDTSSIKVHKLIENIQNKILVYERPEFDGALTTDKLMREYQDLRDKFREYLESRRPPPPQLQRSMLEEKVKRLSVLNNNSSTTTGESLLEYSDGEEKAEEAPESLHERILNVFANAEERILRLEHHDLNNYVFSTFSRSVWCAVILHPEDDRVESIKSFPNLKNNSDALFATLYEFIVKHIMNKLEMANLQSALGRWFDLLSLLHHVNIITEKSFEFCLVFWNTQREYKTLKMGEDGTVSFQVLVPSLRIWWTVEFGMASVENIQQDSLKAVSKWGKINQEHLETILRNTAPGMDCIKRFIAGVADYFKRTQVTLKSKKYKEMNKPAEK